MQAALKNKWHYKNPAPAEEDSIKSLLLIFKSFRLDTVADQHPFL